MTDKPVALGFRIEMEFRSVVVVVVDAAVVVVVFVVVFFLGGGGGCPRGGTGMPGEKPLRPRREQTTNSTHR